MSFSGKVKSELSRQMGSARHCQVAELAALLMFCGTVQLTDPVTEGLSDAGLPSEEDLSNASAAGNRIEVLSEHGEVIDTCMFLLKKAFRIQPLIDMLHTGTKRQVQYRIVIDDTEKATEILQAIGLLDADGNLTEDTRLTEQSILHRNCCRRAFLRGAFLAAGSVSDPERSYHFEIVCGTEILAEQLCALLACLNVDARFVKRQRNQVVYVKEAEQIAEILGLMDARVSLLAFENARIVREVRGNINRKVNCETANINKTANAAVRQIEDIRLIEEKIGLSQLPNGLDEIARIRVQYPEANLRELGEILDPPIGKSGVNHRLRKLSRIAEDLREKRGGGIGD